MDAFQKGTEKSHQRQNFVLNGMQGSARYND